MWLASLGLVIGLWAAVSFFWGVMGEQAYRNWLFVGTVVWFVLATLGNRTRT